MPLILTIDAIHDAYASGDHTPTSLCKVLLSRISECHEAIFIAKPDEAQVFARCRFLESQPQHERGPLWGVPFAVKDNIDALGYQTTCACPAFAYTPQQDAVVVAKLLHAGAIVMGKTNLDQFACGLVGTRSPYGAPPNAMDDRFISGGSSSGSAVAVAKGLVSFALGTDTAGSGRVPAGLNGIVGIKPTVGRCSTKGIVPACFSLDCPSVFALSVKDGSMVASIMENHVEEYPGIEDPTWREPPPLSVPQKSLVLNSIHSKGSSNTDGRLVFRFGLPSWDRGELDFSGPGGLDVERALTSAMDEAVKRLESIGGIWMKDFEFSPFAKTASMLYQGPFVAERYSGIRWFLKGYVSSVSEDDRLLPITRSIISNHSKWNAADVFTALEDLAHLKAAARVQMATVDIIVVPTVAHYYTVKSVLEEENNLDGAKNTSLGRFTNFVNLLDLCGVSVPSSVVHANYDHLQPRDGTESASAIQLPFGVTLLAPAWHDAYVAGIAQEFEQRGNASVLNYSQE